MKPPYQTIEKLYSQINVLLKNNISRYIINNSLSREDA